MQHFVVDFRFGIQTLAITHINRNSALTSQSNKTLIMEHLSRISLNHLQLFSGLAKEVLY